MWEFKYFWPSQNSIADFIEWYGEINNSSESENMANYSIIICLVS